MTYYKLGLERFQSVYREVLSMELSFTDSEVLIIDRDQLTYPKDKNSRYERWRKYIKHNVLSSVYEKMQNDKAALENKDSTYVKFSLKQKINNAKKKLRENLDDYYGSLLREGRIKWLSKYVNSIVVQYDPHTAYYAPVEKKKKFDMSMSGQFEGIGARLQINNGYLTIKEVIVGGPRLEHKANLKQKM